MMRKIILASILLSMISASYLLAQEKNINSVAITTVAVIDIKVIYAAFPSEVRGYSNLNSLKEQYQEEIDQQIEKLNLIKKQLRLALEEGKYDHVSNLEYRITNLSKYINSLSTQRQNELLRLSKLPVSKNFLEKLEKAIEFVAQENGFTIVLNAGTEGLQWWAPVVDISEKVIEKIKS